MIVPLKRTFSEFNQNKEASEENYDYWFQMGAGGKTRLSWSELFSKRIVVILGEAGIGKSVEFQNQAALLQKEDKAAFFIELNKLTNSEAFQRELNAYSHRFETWVCSDSPGYFFLDALDESRLISPTALYTALISVLGVLRPLLRRSSFFISSRITDWSVLRVRETVERTLLKATREAEPSYTEASPDTANTVKIEESDGSPAIEMEIFSLDPLSEQDAKRLAEVHGAKPVDDFWEEIIDGGYEFMATRPLDLEWMAHLWVSKKKLGTYSELIESAIRNRLCEKNQSYIDSGAVLSLDQLRKGAEQVAAACIFSGRPYVMVNQDTNADVAVSPQEALPNWMPQEHQRLLGTAIFDEQTYGRVKFHHRAVREYLAACWVERLINEGLPVSHALELFIKAPYGETVLLSSRRSVLCWLASLNAKIRERVIQQFPEMLMFEGDPQRWSTDDVILAFDGYIKKLESGYRPNWQSDASEIRRVARMLPSRLLSDCIKRFSKSSKFIYQFLSLIEDGKVMSCAEDVFAIYRETEKDSDQKFYALTTLETIASEEQRTVILNDLTSGDIQSNKLIAAALQVVRLKNLTVAQLTEIFQRTQPEPGFGGGAMAISIEIDLLSTLDSQALYKLLDSMLRALNSNNIKELINGIDASEQKEAWILSVLPGCVHRAVELMAGDGNDAPQILVDAALVVEMLRDSIFANDEDNRSLRMEIEKRPELRRRIAHAIAFSGDISIAVDSLTYTSGLVCLRRDDLDWISFEANRDDIDVAERQIWYALALDIAIYQLRGRLRQKALLKLIGGPESKTRAQALAAFKRKRIEHIQKSRERKREIRTKKDNRRRQFEKDRGKLLEDIEAIRDGKALGAIQWLIIYAAKYSSNRNKYRKVSIEPIICDFGNELAEAFSEGLTKAWRFIDVPNPSDYPDNQVPWLGIIGLASVNHAVAKGMDVCSATAEEVTRAFQFCVWTLEKTDPWVERMAKAHMATIEAALMPWFECDLSLAEENGKILRILSFILKLSEELQRPFLDRAAALMRDGKVPGERIQKRILRLLIEKDIVQNEWISELAIRHLMGSIEIKKQEFDPEWFKAWAEANFPASWSWFETNTTAVGDAAPELKQNLVDALDNLDWTKGLSGTEDEVKALISLFKFLSRHVDVSHQKPGDDESPLQQDKAQKLRDSIARTLAKLGGKDSHVALVQLSSECRGTPFGDWLIDLVIEHASAEADRQSFVAPADLPLIGEVYCREPRTEGELFAQVMARLEEIREGIEGGPFSERSLFKPGMEEKHLQLWLASRLSDTPRRRFIPRFVVHREPQVDDENRTDIEVSSAAGKVCIEIKPVDQHRSYSTNSLSDTLKHQLSGQYLKGQNSRHGILVIFRLDKKKWEIPGHPARLEFEDLIRYLREQAAVIEKRDINVHRLIVIGIDCSIS